MNVGIILPYLGFSQAAFLAIKQVNELLETYKNDIVIFYESCMRPCLLPRCSTMNVNEIWNFNGLLISTNISTAKLAVSTVNQAKNVLYLWDLEWRYRPLQYIETVNLFNNQSLGVITRNKMHNKALYHYSNRMSDMIADQFPLQQIINHYANTS